MKAILFDDVEVDIDPRSLEMGGSWQGKDSRGRTCAYDKDLIRFFLFHLKRGDVFLDVGANTGSFSFLCGQMECSCISFEPNQEVIPILKTNLSINNCKTCTIHEVALSDFVGTSKLYIPSKGNSGLACIHPTPRFQAVSEQEIKVTTLDSFALAKVDAIKVDVEGAELCVLRGAVETLKKFHPSLLLEYDERNTVAFNYCREEIEYFLRGLEYRHFQRLGADSRDLWATI